MDKVIIVKDFNDEVVIKVEDIQLVCMKSKENNYFVLINTRDNFCVEVFGMCYVDALKRLKELAALIGEND